MFRIAHRTKYLDRNVLYLNVDADADPDANAEMPTPRFPNGLPTQPWTMEELIVVNGAMKSFTEMFSLLGIFPPV